ncbi:methionine--tRNA ligase [bacterium]|nr:methionine--tRNA ligase [bacterium]
MFKDNLLVTSAIIYANGPAHLGHFAGVYFPADVFVRYSKLKKRNVIHVSGSDEHGVPITFAAIREKTTPKEITDKYYELNKKAFEDFGICFDSFTRTSGEKNHKMAQEFFLNLLEKDALEEKSQKQLFCEHDKMFLSDRYVEGICHHCESEGARGDQCDACGRWIDPLLLKNPKCQLCGNEPVVKETSHFFLLLKKYQNEIEDWFETTDFKMNTKSFCKGLLKQGLEDRAITRDLDWGIPVPLETAKGKVLYVWFDAPIGYISGTQELCEKNKTDWEKWWKNPENTTLVHFLGKDNIIFHAILFPFMLFKQEKNYVLPSFIPASEYLNIGGEKFSKSKNRAIYLKDFALDFEPDTLRYVVARNLPDTKDTDFTLEDFQTKVNSELAGVIGNFVNRSLTFAHKYFEGKLPPLKNELSELDKEMETKILTLGEDVAVSYDNFSPREAVMKIFLFAKFCNLYFDYKEPWKTRKTDLEDCGTTIHFCLQAIQTLASVFAPIMPFTSEKVFKMLNTSFSNYDQTKKLALETGHKFNEAEILFAKIEDEQIENFTEKIGLKRS